MDKKLKICVAGFGNVGKEFCRLLVGKRRELRSEYGCDISLTGVSTRSKGTLMDTEGIEIEEILSMDERLGRFDPNDKRFSDRDVFEMIEKSGADAFIELTTLSIKDGQPATSYIEYAFDHGMHVITANKGPEAWHFERLSRKAESAGKLFLYETAVMDGTPVFNMAKHGLQGNRILKLRGILNGTTNFLLEQLEIGRSYEEAICEAQRMQLTEADPSMDVDGWDGAAKICALANILMSAGVTPDMVRVESIRDVTRQDIEKAGEKCQRIKYVCEAVRNVQNNTVETTVSPQRLSLGDILANVNGTSAALTLHTDLAGEISIVQSNPEILQTAYGVYSDLITLIRAV
jgi:homoserine dehydrogenase